MSMILLIILFFFFAPLRPGMSMPDYRVRDASHQGPPHSTQPSAPYYYQVGHISSASITISSSGLPSLI